MDLNIWIEYSKQIEKAKQLTWDNISKNETNDIEEQQILLRDNIKEVNTKFQQAHQEISMDDIEDVASILLTLALEGKDEELKTYLGLFFFLNENKEGNCTIKIKDYSLTVRAVNNIKERNKCFNTCVAIEEYGEVVDFPGKFTDDTIIDKRESLLREYLDSILKSGIVSNINKDVMNLNDTANFNFIRDVLHKVLFISYTIFESCIQHGKKKKIIYNNNELKD